MSFDYTFDTPAYKGKTSLNTRLYIDGKWVEPVEGGIYEDINPVTGKPITTFSVGSSKDVDIAVEAAKKAYKTVWGLKTPGFERGKLMNRLVVLMEKHQAELAALETLDNGKVYATALSADVHLAIECFRYYAGWADKIYGQTIETTEDKMAYTRHEPYGVVGQIIPWNFPLLMLAWKVAPAMATSNAIILKPSELTPLTALRFTELVHEAGFPPGVFNLVSGLGITVGKAISEHYGISKVAFTGSTLVGRQVLTAAAKTNLKVVTLELGGKAPNIIFDDANLENAVKWTTHGIFLNMGQACTSGSRIYVQESIYDNFMTAFLKATEELSEGTGDPFHDDTKHGPQISQTQFDRIMGHIESGKEQGAKIVAGGTRHGDQGYFITPTVFTDTTPDMKIIKEEIFGPVATIIKFKDEDDVVRQANDTHYGLSSSLFTENVKRAIRVSNALESGSVWVNQSNVFEAGVPFGGYKSSGNGRELGQYALDTYTQVKGVHINLADY